MSQKRDPNWVRTAIEATRMSRLEGKSQKEIASRIGYSSSTVSRMLDYVEHEMKLIRVWVASPSPSEYPALQEIADNLKSQFHLKDVRIVLGSEGVKEGSLSDSARLSLLSAMADKAADYLDKAIDDSTVVAVGRGEFVRMVVDHIHPSRLRERLVILPTSGFLHRKPDRIDSNRIASDLADLLGGDYAWLVAPALVRSRIPEVKKGIREHPLIQQTLAQMQKIKIALVTIAPFPSVLTEETHTREEINGLRKQGAKGEIIGWPFNAAGHPLPVPVEPIGLSLHNLHDIIRREGTVIGVAGADPNRFESIVAALRGRFINVLITDHITAQEVMERAKSKKSS